MNNKQQTLFFFTSLLIFFPQFSTSITTLTTTNSITNNQTLISSGNIFELGFFSPKNSHNWYVGIWYKNIPEKTYIWIANRNNPISNSTGIFKIENQNIVLLDQNRNPIWSSNVTNGKDVVAELLDSGNLILREIGDSNPNNYLWQSFDFPLDTLLPGMKLGWDLTTGLDRFLNSWKNPENPGSGVFNFKLNRNGFPEILLWNKNQVEYRSGPWNGVQFSGVPEMKPLDNLEFEFIANANEISYSFSVTNSTLFSRLIVNSAGVLQRLTWIPDTNQWKPFWYAPEDQCDNYGECGPYGICDSNSSPVCKCVKGFLPRNPEAWDLRDGSDGCVRKTELECLGDKFLRLEGVKLPESKSAVVDRDLNLKGCEDLCLGNCSCTAYANADVRNGGNGCVIWVGELLDVKKFSSGGHLFVRLAASDIGDGGRKNGLIIGLTISIAIALLIIGGVGFFLWKRKGVQGKRKPGKRAPPQKSQELPLTDHVVISKVEYSGERTDDLELPLFDFITIVMATNNFSEENMLGKGGFGCVYKGRLVDGQDIAVKRLSKTSGQGVEELRNEVRLIARLQHRNLVRLVGCCIDIDEKMLIYEYMENRGLDSVLFNKEKSCLLMWQRRFNIISGIARGLLYLHYDSRLTIIHRDLKASNILLDREMNPKISDFGMARIFGSDQDEANTRRIVGTYGYMSPEYAMDGLFSAKSDVFSFGVLVLEIVTGKKNRGFYHPNSELNLLGQAWRSWREGKGFELLDPAIRSLSCSEQEVLRCIQIGLLCVQERAEDRPTMHNVVLMLSSENALMAQPKTPGFALGSDGEADISLNESYTVNQVTVTMLDAR